LEEETVIITTAHETRTRTKTAALTKKKKAVRTIITTRNNQTKLEQTRTRGKKKKTYRRTDPKSTLSIPHDLTSLSFVPQIQERRAFPSNKTQSSF
jgi:hypothetical protein